MRRWVCGWWLGGFGVRGVQQCVGGCVGGGWGVLVLGGYRILFKHNSLN